MKLLIAALLATFSALAQYSNVTIIVPDPSTTSGQAYAIPVTIMAVGFPNIIAAAKSLPPNGGFPNAPGALPANTMLAVSIANTGTHAACSGIPNVSSNAVCSTITLASTTNLASCNGLLFATGEMMEVYSISGSTALVLRGLIATTAAIHSSGEAVTVTRFGEGSCILKALIADGIAGIVQRQQADSTTLAAAAAIATNQATITSTAQGSVQ